MSKILAQVMVKESLTGLRILEIGCGIALPSIVIKQLGGDITASDYHPLAQRFLVENAILNSLARISYKNGNWNSKSSGLGKFDLIIGSDVLYEQDHVELLSSFINLHASKSANVIIVDPGRGSHRTFAKVMERLGYMHTWTDLALYSEAGIRPPGFILRFVR